ncbi:MAG: class I SAM-dependent methyltransferase [Alphaproteobacteria bacterium PRO2]|nr:class I SAM-dependent methyltransferase [Alphaproteobacteria bacterium PRO2]
MMYRSAYDLKSFYNTKVGRMVRRILQERIREFWPETQGLRVLGCGYATPYLRLFMDNSERVLAAMPAGQGAHHWPYNHPGDDHNLVCLAEEAELPFETSSIDRVILIHSVEFSEHLQQSLAEIWRVLKSNGRLLVVVPNRSGFWARADWSPFGQGTPYSASQIIHYLRDNQFIHERTDKALFMPPVKFAPLLKSAGFFENFGRHYFPFGSGVHMVEATKQVYAKAGPGEGSKVTVRRRGYVPRAVPGGV